MKHRRLLILVLFCFGLAIGRAQIAPMDPFRLLANGSVKALHDVLGTGNSIPEFDSLLHKSVLPNPFIGHPEHDLGLFYDRYHAIQYRPEAGVFFYIPDEFDTAPPTLCNWVERSAGLSGINGLATLPEDSIEIVLSAWEAYCSPSYCQQIHRLLTVHRSLSLPVISRLLTILSRWDPGLETWKLIDLLTAIHRFTSSELALWKTGLSFCASPPSEIDDLNQFRSDQYQKQLDIYPFVYDEPVDFWGRVLLQCQLDQHPPFAPLYDLIQSRHPRALYYLAALAYRTATNGMGPADTLYLSILRSATGMEILDQDMADWLIHLYHNHTDWVWSDQQGRFIYYPELSDHQLLVESWFRYLASPDPEIATTFYKQIIDSDPTIVQQHSGTFRRLLTQWNPVLPPANLPFPEITSTYRHMVRLWEKSLQLPDSISSVADQLKQPLNLGERIRLEDNLIQKSNPDHLHAWEALALEWVAFPDAERSLSRIVDKLYQDLDLWLGLPADQHDYVSAAGLFLDPDRGDAASRYWERIPNWVDTASPLTWMKWTTDAAAQRAIAASQYDQRIDQFMAHSESFLAVDLIGLPLPESRSESEWLQLIKSAKTLDAKERIIQYFRIYPREFQTGEILRIWPSWTASTSPPPQSTEDALIQLLEYVSGLYDLQKPLEWWLLQWRGDHQTWAAMIERIHDNLELELEATHSATPTVLAFLLRTDTNHPMDRSLWKEVIQNWDDPVRCATLPFVGLSIEDDLPYFQEIGVPAYRLAEMAGKFDLHTDHQISQFLAVVLSDAEPVEDKVQVANSLFSSSWYRQFIADAEQADFRKKMALLLESSFEENLWLSAFDEATIWAQIIWCITPDQPTNWIDLILVNVADPLLQSQVFQLLIRDLTFNDLKPVLIGIGDLDQTVQQPFLHILLDAFALPPIDWNAGTAFHHLLTSPGSPSLTRVYAEALHALSPSFKPPSDSGNQEAWMKKMLTREYIRPLFGFHAPARKFPVVTVLSWWILNQFGEDQLQTALEEYRRTGDVYTLVKAASLQDDIRQIAGPNSLFSAN